MAFENVRVEYGNLSINVVDGASFFTVDHVTNQLIEKTSTGSVIFPHFMETDITEVHSLSHDGIFFWTLEKAGTVGIVVRKWLIGDNNLVTIDDAFSFISTPATPYDSYTMAAEWYSDSLDNQITSGTTVFDVNDGSEIRAGDKITIGPSTATGFVGNKFETDVLSVVGVTVTISLPITSTFDPNDPIYFTRSFFVFSDSAPFNTESGSLYKFDAQTGVILGLNTSNLFKDVKAATFFKGKLMFIKGGEIIWLDPLTQNVFKSQSIDNLSQNRASHFTTFDLTGFGDTFYRLEEQVVFLSGGEYDIENWSEFNYNTSTTLSQVYFVSVKADPLMIHKSVAGLTPTSNVVVQALDQFRTPLFNRSVSLSSTAGSLSPTSGTTDSEGKFSSVYTADSSVGQVEIQATIT